MCIGHAGGGVVTYWKGRSGNCDKNRVRLAGIEPEPKDIECTQYELQLW